MRDRAGSSSGSGWRRWWRDARLRRSWERTLLFSFFLLTATTGCSTGTGQPVEPGNVPIAYEQKLKPSPVDSFERFGRAVDVAGQVVVVSSLGSSAPGSVQGSVYVFRNLGDEWLPEARLTAQTSDPTGFGHRVATDGANVVVTAPLESGVTSRDGAAFLYVRSDSGWQVEARFEPSVVTTNGLFGTSMSLDGSTVAFGAPGGERQFVYLFEMPESGAEASDVLESPSLAGSTRFGSELALSGDWLAVGTGSDEEETGPVFLYRRAASGWGLLGKIEVPVDAARFGTSLAIDGTTLLVGAIGRSDGPVVYVFRWNGEEWYQDGRLRPEGTDSSPNPASSHFGAAVAVEDGLAVVGAPGTDREGEVAVGVVYRFERSESGWQQLPVPTVATEAEDALGVAVATNGAILAIGATGDDEGARDSGAVYLFRVGTEGALRE